MARYPWYPELYAAHMRSRSGYVASPRMTRFLACVAIAVVAAYAALLCAIMLG